VMPTQLREGLTEPSRDADPNAGKGLTEPNANPASASRRLCPSRQPRANFDNDDYTHNLASGAIRPSTVTFLVAASFETPERC